MTEPAEAARDLLQSTRKPAREWRREREIKEHSSSEVDVPSRREVLLDKLDALTGSDHVLEENVEDVIELVDEWSDAKLEEVRSRVRELAELVVTRGGESAEETV